MRAAGKFGCGDSWTLLMICTGYLCGAQLFTLSREVTGGGAGLWPKVMGLSEVGMYVVGRLCLAREQRERGKGNVKSQPHDSKALMYKGSVQAGRRRRKHCSASRRDRVAHERGKRGGSECERRQRGGVECDNRQRGGAKCDLRLRGGVECEHRQRGGVFCVRGKRDGVKLSNPRRTSTTDVACDYSPYVLPVVEHNTTVNEGMDTAKVRSNVRSVYFGRE